MRSSSKYQVPIIDLFAGPGGLSHGFTSFADSKISFRIGLSIEKDVTAHKTLLLRAFVRQFKSPPHDYYRFIQGDPLVSREELQARYKSEWARANKEAKQWELGKIPFSETHKAIREALSEAPTIGGNQYWVLLGGPPCQAYSVIGRARMKGDANFKRDHRHLLYREYLKIVAAHQPAIFVMENVKGILSSKHGARSKDLSIFQQIKQDFEDPILAVKSEPDMHGHYPKKTHKYNIFSFVTKASTSKTLEPKDFVIRSEDWGIPQKRHRVILLGVRDDITATPPTLGELFGQSKVTIGDLIDNLPKIRSRLSKEKDDPKQWVDAVRDISKYANSISDTKVRKNVLENLKKLKPIKAVGQPLIRGDYSPRKCSNLIYDKKLGGVIQHEGRSHMRSDLMRYFFAACSGQATGNSPKLAEYPEKLLPKHKNASASRINDSKHSGKKIDFSDRFRVQLRDQPATTITSHISKDGHYYIHHDPLQCRSLTLREAARLQTFPDSYFFEGGQTARYHQVGNAVPPALAIKLARVVAALIRQAT